ncbi:ROK family protein [Marinobacter sp. SS21]|uniref:ROK family protein n=1 Tax=Marinobacter sp. SS21 TaxID=2979460 RepID=UPI00232D9A9B|nr:ROK family protein [Marinobacter sp. SS21]MDC0663356.1 ROK family protein [Marinobacter sp. SS21]
MSDSWMIGVDLGGTKTEVILLDRDSREYFRLRQPTPPGDYAAGLEVIRSLVGEAESAAGVRGISVGVGIPGTVSRRSGRVKNANSTCLNGRPLAADLQRTLQRPVTLTNDANCLALSEATDGAGKGYEVVLAVILGTGCGAGVSVRGQLLTGPNGLAGEWGHNPLPWTSQEELARRPCFCGQLGCVETFLSGTGLSLTHRLLWRARHSAQDIVAAAAGGDRAARRTLDHYMPQLARGLASVINVLDPDIIVVGGGLSNAQAIYGELPRLLRDHVFGGECDTPVVPARHGDSSGVRGAAWLGAL